MANLIYATGNKIKFLQAQNTCNSYGIRLIQNSLGVTEIQDEDGEVVARDKAKKAFEKFGKPVVISDDNWQIPGLKNFPGPYMKSINTWFTPDDWLRLTSKLADRRIFLQQIIVYQDQNTQELFNTNIEGILLKEARGKSPYAHSYITSFDGGIMSDAEYHDKRKSSLISQRNTWNDFATWYFRNHKINTN